MTTERQTRWLHGTGMLYQNDALLAEVRYSIALPENTALIVPKRDMQPALLNAFLHQARLTLQWGDSPSVELHLTEHHDNGMWMAQLSGPVEA
ncbi:MAG: hypothetical protein OHK0022_00280 [Roseiflexaceae bacterium]